MSLNITQKMAEQAGSRNIDRMLSEIEKILEEDATQYNQSEGDNGGSSGEQYY